MSLFPYSLSVWNQVRIIAARWDSWNNNASSSLNGYPTIVIYNLHGSPVSWNSEIFFGPAVLPRTMLRYIYANFIEKHQIHMHICTYILIGYSMKHFRWTMQPEQETGDSRQYGRGPNDRDWNFARSLTIAQQRELQSIYFVALRSYWIVSNAYTSIDLSSRLNCQILQLPVISLTHRLRVGGVRLAIYIS